MQVIVERHTRPGQVVCDPFLGGGATAVASQRCGRPFIGGDIDPHWVEVTRARLAEEGGGMPAESE